MKHISILNLKEYKIMITLYKKDSKNKLRVLQIFTKGAELIQRSGLENGALVEVKKTCKGKNIGKKNETSPNEQAIIQMKSKITEKLKTDYFSTKNEAMNSIVILPMLAEDYKDKKNKINWKDPVYCQPKMDGMRCLAIIENNNVKLLSRENTDIIKQYSNSMKHLIPELSKLSNGIYDGELYAHSFTFQENMELIKKYRPNKSENVKFHTYDLVSNDSFEKRFLELKNKTSNCSVIVLVETTLLKNEEHLKNEHIKNLNNGFEGSIIRYGDNGYELNKRSNNLLKYKDFKDIAIKIKDIEPAPQRPEWGVPVFEWKGAENDELRAGMKFSHDFRKEFLLNKKDYIGKVAELRFFEFSDEGVPRFPVCVGFRLDK